MKRFHAKGKLLLSAEYMVLHGSTALAIPLKLGQSLEITPSADPERFTWTAFHKQEPWFMATLDPATLEVQDSSNLEMAFGLSKHIGACIELVPSFREALYESDAATRLDFPPDYGFGSSSTLIALLAGWAEVDPLDLHFMVSEGSGYDVACAVSDGPITYRLKDHLPQYNHVPFNPPFREQIWFAWLGHKQATAPHLAEMAGRLSPNIENVAIFSQLSQEMIDATNLEQFRKTMDRHEETLSHLLGIDPVSERFINLPGSVKSLGAWGGDFVMIATEEDKQSLQKYLSEYGIRTLYSYKDLIYEKG
jgi:mevalonate kinase